MAKACIKICRGGWPDALHAGNRTNINDKAIPTTRRRSTAINGNMAALLGTA